MLIDNRDVIRWIGDLGVQLATVTSELADLDQAAVRAKVTYEREYAKAFLINEGSVDQRKQQALLDTESVRLGHYLAESAVRACMERIRTLRSRIEIGRSVNAAQRSELAASGLGQT